MPRGLDHSQSKLHYEVQKKKEKISNTTNKRDYTLETEKKNGMQKQNWGRGGGGIDKKSITHTIKQAFQSPTSVQGAKKVSFYSLPFGQAVASMY